VTRAREIKLGVHAIAADVRHVDHRPRGTLLGPMSDAKIVHFDTDTTGAINLQGGARESVET
jgi:hypothetical protein